MAVTRSLTGNLPAKTPSLNDTALSDEEFDPSYGNGNRNKRIKVKKNFNKKKALSCQVIKKQALPISSSPSSLSNDKKLPLYKVEQLEKLNKLLRMSNIAKPRSMVGEYGSFEGDIKLKISKDSHTKISPLTNYDPIRDGLIKGELNEEEKSILRETYQRQKRLKSIKVKDLSKDIYLKVALNILKSKRLQLRSWKCSDMNFKEVLLDSDKLALNEIGVNLLSLDNVQCNILEANKEYYGRAGVHLKTGIQDLKPKNYKDIINYFEPFTNINIERPVIKIPPHCEGVEKVNSIDMIGKSETLFRPIDVDAIKKETELVNLKRRNQDKDTDTDKDNDNDNDNDTDNDNPYRGLKIEDNPL